MGAKTIADCRSVLATLFSNDKCDADSTMPTKCYAITGALDGFDWEQLKVGAIYSIICTLAGVHF